VIKAWIKHMPHSLWGNPRLNKFYQGDKSNTDVNNDLLWRATCAKQQGIYDEAEVQLIQRLRPGFKHSHIIDNHPVATRPRYDGALVIPADVPRQPRKATQAQSGSPFPVENSHRFNEMIMPVFSTFTGTNPQTTRAGANQRELINGNKRPTSALHTAGSSVTMATGGSFNTFSSFNAMNSLDTLYSMETLSFSSSRSSRSARSARSARSSRGPRDQKSNRSTMSERHVEQLRQLIVSESRKFTDQAHGQLSELQELMTREASRTAEANQRLAALTERMSAVTN
jgi:hypothetical protein